MKVRGRGMSDSKDEMELLPEGGERSVPEPLTETVLDKELATMRERLAVEQEQLRAGQREYVTNPRKQVPY